MKNKFIEYLYSYKTSIVLLFVYALLMAIATIVEKHYGTPTAKWIIYYSPIFILIQVLLCISFILIAKKKRLFNIKRWHVLTLHGAFLVILLGAGVTHFFSKEGVLHIREGEKNNILWVDEGESTDKLPFDVKLDKFEIIRYPGSMSPSSYESYVSILDKNNSFSKKIYMNHTLDYKGYRFFQSSYDDDEKGSILSVSYDFWGRNISYTGYLLLFIGLIGSFFNKNSRFMIARKKLSRLSTKSLLLIGLLYLSPSFVHCQEKEDIPQEHIKAFGMLPVQSESGRIIPMNTLSTELVNKLKLQKIVKYSPDKWLLEVLANPSKWSNKPIILIGSKQLQKIYFPNKGQYISYIDAFDKNGNYIFSDKINEIYQKSPGEQTKLDKDLIKLDERINIIYQLRTLDLIRVFPSQNNDIKAEWNNLNFNKSYINALRDAIKSGNWSEADKQLDNIKKYQKTQAPTLIDENKLKAEFKYNKHNWLNTSKKIYLITGAIALILSFVTLMFREKKYFKIIKYLSLSVVFVGFVLETYCLILRWYISGYAPWSNSYETLVTMSWISVLIGFIIFKKDLLTFALATIFGGIAVFVSELSWMDPQITPLVPVLKSPWLMYHVATIMTSYGFLGISCLIGAISLIFLGLQDKHPQLRLQAERLSLINEMLMIIGCVLMGIGIFLGAIWANESWGRYWSWDPKETWALISLIIYAIVLHIHWFFPIKDNRRFNLMSQWAFISILMTYFGVNFFLSGMHSYGKSDALLGISPTILLPILIFFFLPGILAYSLTKKSKS